VDRWHRDADLLDLNLRRGAWTHLSAVFIEEIKTVLIEHKRR